VDHSSLYSLRYYLPWVFPRLAVIIVQSSYGLSAVDDARRDSLGCVSALANEEEEVTMSLSRFYEQSMQSSLYSILMSSATMHGLWARVISSTCNIVPTWRQACTVFPKGRYMHACRKVPRTNRHPWQFSHCDICERYDRNVDYLPMCPSSRRVPFGTQRIEIRNTCEVLLSSQCESKWCHSVIL
jgi:hypothetical protein